MIAVVNKLSSQLGTHKCGKELEAGGGRGGRWGEAGLSGDRGLGFIVEVQSSE